MENPLPEEVSHAELHSMEEVGHREVAPDTGNMSKYVESSVNMARSEFVFGSLSSGIAELSI